ncbi:GNAT family N-acetyltransferase [Paenibacillus frigoriresistens]|uniref:GNAT family N-acetyltransferase n=1 Tax=Paenibacillus alginolyticus TaxID=59839 RepID=UPI001565C123|nr:GNAT family N-acetyltransferase [Paenibacillus frigoriresistens]NRF95790.1 GNAT family N-acetyltransferase [Paenibacillus frigoriresistens]
MLDKTIPHFNVIMKRSAGVPLPRFALPEGYSFTWYVPGKEEQWAEIESSVGEFENVEQGLDYFRNEYLPFVEELKRRLLFVQNEDGEEIGTITSWWNLTGERRDPSVHWFAVKKEYQGVGVGKALVSECLNRLQLLEGDRNIFLHTQTWSYKAIGLYLNAGFEILSYESFAHYKNDYDIALPILKTVLHKPFR